MHEPRWVRDRKRRSQQRLNQLLWGMEMYVVPERVMVGMAPANAAREVLWDISRRPVQAISNINEFTRRRGGW